MPHVVDLRQSTSSVEVAGEACAALRRGELVGLPSETCYLLAGSAVRQEAAKRLAESAAQHGTESAVLLLSHLDALFDFVESLPTAVERLLNRCWPGPVVLRLGSAASGAFADLAPAAQHLLQRSHVPVCVPAHPFLRRITELYEEPILAMISSLPAGKTWSDSDGLEVARIHAAEVGLVVDAGPPRHPQGPTLIDMNAGEPGTAAAGWKLIKEGVVAETMLNRLSSTMVLFVCTGNTCRSPMAEGLFRKLLSERLDCLPDEIAQKGYLVLSGGVSAVSGMPAAPEAIRLLEGEQVDLRDHSSQPVTEDLLAQSDHVLAMTAGHLDTLYNEFPMFRGKMRMLSPGRDISDPIGRGWSVYQECGAEIRTALEDFLDELLQENGKAPSK
jgi:L-threonylcarbamoyladenylate synthase